MSCRPSCPYSVFFFFNDTATTEIYTLSLHDALPISPRQVERVRDLAEDIELKLLVGGMASMTVTAPSSVSDRKSTRLNSSHGSISYAVFCLKKKKIVDRHP